MSAIALVYVLFAEGIIGLTLIAAPFLIIIAIIALCALGASGPANTSHR